MRGHSRSSRGLTLVELLVSMVIMGFVMTLVAQAVFQVGHIVRVADESVIRLGERWRAGWSLLPIMNNLVAPVEAGDRPLVGTAVRFEGHSTVSLWGDDTGVHPVVFALRPDGQKGTEMVYESVGGRTGVGDRGQVLARWPGRIELRYQATRGTEEIQWPPLTRTVLDGVLLPESIRLIDVGSGAMVMAFQVPAPAERQLPPGLDPFGTRVGN